MARYVEPTVYERIATVLRVVDGDTLHVAADLGLDVVANVTVRLYGINAPEMSTDVGKAAKVFVEAWVKDRGPVFALRTVKDKREKYGRYLADLVPADGSPTLCAALLASGHAVYYVP